MYYKVNWNGSHFVKTRFVTVPWRPSDFVKSRYTSICHKTPFVIHLTEPSAAPENVTGHNSSSTSILVTWGEVPAADQNGIILTYTIAYESLTENHNGNITVNYPDRQTNLTGLREYVNYSVTVFASTVKGDGPTSNPILVITDQDSKWFVFVHLCVCVSLLWPSLIEGTGYESR